MNINGLDVIGKETGAFAIDEAGEIVAESSVGQQFHRFWFRDIHSGSEAVESARQILANPNALSTGEFSLEILFICSELIFRITGEQIIPEGFVWYGKTLTNLGVCEIEF